jgi:hypothetical protein
MAFNCIAGHLTGFTQSPAVSNQTRKQRDGDRIASCTARQALRGETCGRFLAQSLPLSALKTTVKVC